MHGARTAGESLSAMGKAPSGQRNFQVMRKELIVIGGGAAGFFCAVNAAAKCPGLSVTVLEKSSRLLNKVRISGGGRCNVTHACFRISQMVENYPRGSRFLKKAFHHFFTTDTINWFAQRGVSLKTEDDGRMFPVTDDSQTIIDCLVQEASQQGVRIWMNHDVVSITKVARRFHIELRDGKTLRSDFVCVAAGGFPRRESYQFMASLGHPVQPPVPSLFTFNIPGSKISELMGIGVPARVKILGTKFVQEGPLLITHWGLSGPAVLKLSAFAALELHALNYVFTIVVNWLPQYHESAVYVRLMEIEKEMAVRMIGNKNPFELPQRLWQHHLEACGIDAQERWANLKAAQRSALARSLCSSQYHVKGKTTFKEEFVTAGGVNLDEVQPNTMQSKTIDNLFFAGEILNIDGITGGFNFQSAWTTGYLAAAAIARLANGENTGNGL